MAGLVGLETRPTVIARRWQVLIVTSVAVCMAFLDMTIVNIAFPAIRHGFGDASIAHMSWVLNAYNLVFAAALVPAGRLADRLGRRRLFLAGSIVFLGASVACGAALNVNALIGARALQAVGAAMLVPASLSLVLAEFPLERRATATALWTSAGTVAAAAGPSLGGLLVDWQGWRWIFFVNLLLGVPALLAARRLLAANAENSGQTGPIPDWLGALLLMGGVGGIALGLVEGPDWGWRSAGALGSFSAGLALLGFFVRRSARHPVPVFELALFRVRSFAAANAALFVFSTGFYALLPANVLFLTSQLALLIIQSRPRPHPRTAHGGAHGCAWRPVGRSVRSADRRRARGLAVRARSDPVRGSRPGRAGLRVAIPPGDDPRRRKRRLQLRRPRQCRGCRVAEGALCDRQRDRHLFSSGRRRRGGRRTLRGHRRLRRHHAVAFLPTRVGTDGRGRSDCRSRLELTRGRTRTRTACGGRRSRGAEAA